MIMRKFVHLQSANSNDTISNNSISGNQTSITKKIVDHVSTFPLYAIILIIVAILLLIIVAVVCILRKKTRDKYEDSPENFSRKPNLSIFKRMAYKSMNIQAVLSPQAQQIQTKNDYQGQVFQVKFKGEKSCLYFDNKLRHDSYFEIQIIKISSVVQIGFIPVQNIDQLTSKDSDRVKINLDKYGVSLASDGEIIANGQKKFNLQWYLSYGDVIGIGMTKHKTGVRIWITKNGILLNRASEEQMLKNIDLNKQQAIQSKKQIESESGQNEQKRIKLLQQLKKKIELKMPKKFQFYAVVSSEGASNQKQTIINWNVGAHTFRLFDGNALGGLLD